MDRILNVHDIAEHLRASEVFRNKRHIQPMADIFADFSPLFGIRNGDDAAAIPHGGSHLLLAAEGITEQLVRNDPYLAGRCAVLANVNDIYAMGGRPLAMVDVVGTVDEGSARDICRGIRDNALRFQVPVVGGHVLRTQFDTSVALAILGVAGNLITSFDARPGDHLLLVTRREGVWLADSGYWNCTLASHDDVLVPSLELLPGAAEKELVLAGKDVSMAGIAGTTLMLAEGSGVGAVLNLDAITPPQGVPLQEWLLAFMSYGFVLAVADDRLPATVAHFTEYGLEAAIIGAFRAEKQVTLEYGGQSTLLWDLNQDAFTGAGV